MAKQSNCPPQAAREFEEALSHLEEATFRLIRGLALKEGRIATVGELEDTAGPRIVVLKDVPMEGQLNLVDEIDAIDVDNPPEAA